MTVRIVSAGPALRTATEPSLRTQVLSFALAKAVPGAVGLLGVLALVDVLPPPAYAMYGLSVASALVAVNATGGWLVQSTLRYSGHPDLGFENVPTGLVATCATGGAVVSALTLGALGHGVAITSSQLAATGALAACWTVHNIRLAGLQARGSGATFARAEIVRGLVTLALSVSAAALFQRADAAVAATAVATAVGTVGITLPTGSARTACNPDARKLLIPWLAFGAPLSLWLSGSAVLQTVDRTILAPEVGLDRLGDLTGAYELVTRGTAMVMAPLVLATHARTTWAWNNHRPAEARLVAKLLLRWQLGLGATILLLAVPASAVIAHLVPAAAFLTDPVLVLPLAAAAVVWQVALSAHRPLERDRRTGAMLLALAGAIVVKVAVTVGLAGALGVAASGFATLAAGLFYIAACAWAASRKAATT